MTRPEPTTAWSRPFALIEMDPTAQYSVYKDQPSLGMTYCHNVYLRSLNFLLWQAPRIEPARLADFLGYVIMWANAMHEHHAIEESIYFPMLETYLGKGTLIENNHQHRNFTQQVSDMATWAKSVRADSTQWDSAELERQINAFAPALVEHLRDEIETLRPERIERAMTQEQYDQISQSVTEHIKKEADPSFLCFYICNHVVDSHPTANAFPELPWIVDKIFRLWQWNRQSRELQFGVSDRWSRLKALPEGA